MRGGGKMELEDGRIGRIELITSDKHLYLDRGLTIFYVVSGQVTFSYLGQAKSVKQGELFVQQSALEVEIMLAKAQLVMISLQADFTDIFNLNKLIISCASQDSKRVEYQHLVNLVQALIDYVSVDSANYQANIAYGKVIEIIQYLSANFSKQLLSKQLQIRDVIEYLRLNYNQALDLVEIAKHFGVSPQYLSKFFKAKHGNNFNQELTDIRLYNAARQLVNEDKGIIDVAYDSGFNSIATFNRAFKKHYQMTPANYRLSHQNKVSVVPVEQTKHSLALLAAANKREVLTVNANDKQEPLVLPRQVYLDSNPTKQTLTLLAKLGIERVVVTIPPITNLDAFLYSFNQQIDPLLRAGYALVLAFATPSLSYLQEILRYFINLIGIENMAKWQVQIDLQAYQEIPKLNKILGEFKLDQGLVIAGRYRQLKALSAKLVPLKAMIKLYSVSGTKADTLAKVKSLKTLGYQKLGVVLHGFFEANLKVLNDTEYLGVDLVAQVLALQGQVDFVETPKLYDDLQPKLVAGQMGLATSNGLLKAAYYALRLLNKVDPNLVYADKKTVVTKDSVGNYNLTLLNQQPILNQQVLIDYQNYPEILATQTRKVTIRLKGIANGQYRLKKRIVSRHTGNLIRVWGQLGFIQQHLTVSEGQYLAHKTLPDIFIKELVVKDNLAVFELELAANELVSLHLIKLYWVSKINLKINKNFNYLID